MELISHFLIHLDYIYIYFNKTATVYNVTKIVKSFIKILKLKKKKLFLNFKIQLILYSIISL